MQNIHMHTHQFKRYLHTPLETSYSPWLYELKRYKKLRPRVSYLDTGTLQDAGHLLGGLPQFECQDWFRN